MPDHASALTNWRTIRGPFTVLELIPTGVRGLDEILRGGLPRNTMHLMEGPPGCGKTTAALQFLRRGHADGEPGLYVSLSQSASELERVADAYGWSLEGIELVALEVQTDVTQSDQTIFATADLRLDRTRQAIEHAIDSHRPTRIVYDSLLEVRLLTTDLTRYQRELIGLRAFLHARGITALLLDTDPSEDVEHDTQSRSIVHGVITMDKELPAFGRAHRRIEVAKMRGVPILDGWHDMDIREGEGVVVFPRIVATERDTVVAPAGDGVELIRSGRERLDAMFGGGMETGTTTLIVGQAGTGKSTIASLYARAALERGEQVALFLFEERLETFFRRSEGLGLDMRAHHAAGRLVIYDFDPDEITAGEFARLVLEEIRADDLRVVVIDSFTGYMKSLANEAQALFDIQALLRHLARRNILTILVVAQHGLLGFEAETRVDLSHLGDTVLLLRLEEADGRTHRSIVPVKKRHGPHDMRVHELVIAPGQVDVGPPRTASA